MTYSAYQFLTAAELNADEAAVAAVAASVTAEATARAAGDAAEATARTAAISTAVSTETTARIAGDATEAASRGAAVAAEAALRTTGDATSIAAVATEAAARAAAIAGLPVVTRFTLLPAGATHAPTTRGDTSTEATAFTGDLSECGWAFGYHISGTNTLGTPATGYLYTPENSMYFDYLLNTSGWNQNTGDNNGRTAATCHYTRVDQQGQGDCMGYVVVGNVTSARSGASTWLANPAISAYDSDFTAGVAHCYLNPRETDISDGGFDCAAIGDVVNCFRSINTAALGDPWIAYRVQSLGAAAIDAAFSVSGKTTIGMDLTTATLGTQKAAITLAGGQRIYLQATNGGALGMPKDTNPTGAYIATDPTGLGSLVLNGTPGGGGAVSVNLTGGALVTITGELLISGGPCLPVTDNAYPLGGSSNRWTQLFAGSGTINTSDETEKQDIAEIPAALMDAWDAVSPRAFRFVSAVAKKGAGARFHTGYIAQEFAAALMAQSLVPAGWGGWCTDVVKSGGELQGLRYDELAVIADAAHRRKIGLLAARMTAAETAIQTLSTAFAAYQTAHP